MSRALKEEQKGRKELTAKLEALQEELGDAAAAKEALAKKHDTLKVGGCVQ